MNLLPKDIEKLIKEHQIEMASLKKYRNAIDNKYEIEKKEVTGGANNKCPVNFAKKIKNNVHGYMFGEPFNITHKSDDKLQEFFSEMFAYNNKHKLLSGLGEEMLDIGKAYWLLYIDKNQYLKILQVPREEMIFIRNEKDRDIIDMAIRYYYRDCVDLERQELVVELYTDEEVYYYVEDSKGGLKPDYSGGEAVRYHIFREVPVIEFLNNDGESEYKDALPLINLYINLLNLGVDEASEIRNAYLAVLNASLEDKDIEKALKSRVFLIESAGNNEQQVDIRFLNKNINTESFESFLDRVRRLIFEVAGIPDTQSLEQKTQELSAKAMKQLLRELENKCIIKENNIRYALSYFLRIVRQYVKIKAGLDYNLSDFEISFKRNLPETSKVSVDNMADFVSLKETGLLDKETLMNLLGFVGDVQNIIEKKEAEDKAEYGIDFGFKEEHGGEV